MGRPLCLFGCPRATRRLSWGSVQEHVRATVAKKAKAGSEPEQAASAAEFDYVDITHSNEIWSEFTLADGSVLRLKPSLVDVQRQRGKFSPDGNPIYNINAGLLIGVRAPDGLRLGAKPKRGRKA